MRINLETGPRIWYDRRMKRPLPPLNSIRAFEAAARHLNFSRAAEELGVTQGAISKQILTLEDFIGTKLFERLPGGMELTQGGMYIRNAVTPVFEQLGQTFSRYSRRPPRSNIFRLSTVGSFAGQFLVPRLDKFAQDLPHIELELLTSARLVDFAREEIDLSVRYGAGGWDDVIYQKLVDGQLIPVCSPELLPANYTMADAASLMQRYRRIQIFTRNEWCSWFGKSGIDHEPLDNPFIIEEFVVALKAVLTGQGLGLMPDLLVNELVQSGRLARFSDVDLDWNQTFYLVHGPNAEKRPFVKDVMAWIKAEAAIAMISRHAAAE